MLKFFSYILLIFIFTFNIWADNSKKVSKVKPLEDKRETKMKIKGKYYNVINAYYWKSSEIAFDKEVHKKYNPKAGLWLPLAESIGFNLLLGAYNRYVTNSHFAKISFSSIKKNFQHGLDWDADDLYTNFWRHPYQGSIYFNTARSNGYNYYESMGVAFLGSLQWEFFMEIEPAAVNDVILTTFAGAMVGEAFYRLSNHFIDETSSGFERFFREGSLTFFNPGRFINRVARGRSARSMDKRIYERRRYFADLKIGINKLNILRSFEHNQKSIYLRFSLNYDDPFIKKRIKPFDHFYLTTVASPTEENPLSTFRLFSVLYGKKIISKKRELEFIFGLFQNFDYIQNDIYQISTLDLSIGFMFKRKLRNETLLTGSLMFGAVPMAGVDSEYAKYYLVDSLNMSRNYNLGGGATYKVNLSFHIPYVTLKSNYTIWYMKTYHGAKGSELVGIFEPAVHINILERISFGMQAIIYHRKADYSGFPDIDMLNRNYKAFVEFKL